MGLSVTSTTCLLRYSLKQPWFNKEMWPLVTIIAHQQCVMNDVLGTKINEFILFRKNNHEKIGHQPIYYIVITLTLYWYTFTSLWFFETL